MLQKARNLAVAKGGECLASEWKNVNTKIKWRCSTGHEWETTYSCVAYTKSWCRQCATEARAQVLREKAYDVMIVTAQKHHIRCETSKEDYINVLQKVGWTCLICSNHFSTSWKIFATTCNFRCWKCTARVYTEEASSAERARVAEIAARERVRLAEITRLAEIAQQKDIAVTRAKTMDELLARDPPRYSKTEARSDSTRTNSPNSCTTCEGRLEVYNADRLCTSCSARRRVEVKPKV